MLRSLRFALPLVAVCSLLTAPGAQAASAPVFQADLSGDINTVADGYVTSTLQQAIDQHASAYLLVLNTPGGFSTSMDDIVTHLLNSPIPTIVYVAPTGARAASAGLFIAQAADVLAMAPGTNIGSAHPIDASGQNLTGDLGVKVLNDAVTRVRSLATMHHRNPDWCEDAVRNSVNINADSAVSLHVADLEVASVSALLAAIDGRSLPRASGSLTLHTAGVAVSDSPPPFWLTLLNALIDPTVAALLLLLAAFGIITELSTPGAILPGVAGSLAGILAVVSLLNLPVDFAGLLLLGLAFALFIADIHAHTHGILSVGGLAAFALGLAFLINTGPIGLGVNPWAIALISLALFAFFVLFINRVWVVRHAPPFGGPEALVGSQAVVRTPLAPTGEVFIAGALWSAHSDHEIPSGRQVKVIARHGLDLEVEEVQPST